MSTVFESLDLTGLRRTHLEQLLWYINEQEREGAYYGNYEQFMNRHKELKDWIGNAVEYAKTDGVVFPKKRKDKK